MTVYWSFNDQGKIAFDSVTKKATVYNASGVQTNVRDFTVEETSTVNRAEATAAQIVNEATIKNALNTALTTIQTLIDTPNPTIKADPQVYIKDIAKNQKKIIRLITRRLEQAD